jgi:hypothetical protein
MWCAIASTPLFAGGPDACELWAGAGAEQNEARKSGSWRVLLLLRELLLGLLIDR